MGLILVSPKEVTGNSKGKPPASQTPLLTHSANSRKCALQGVNSDHVLQMPMTGRPSNTSDGYPRIQLRWMKPSLSFGLNHAAERNCLFSVITFSRDGTTTSTSMSARQSKYLGFNTGLNEGNDRRPLNVRGCTALLVPSWWSDHPQ